MYKVSELLEKAKKLKTAKIVIDLHALADYLQTHNTDNLAEQVVDYLITFIDTLGDDCDETKDTK